jgi:hypothetical protein
VRHLMLGHLRVNVRAVPGRYGRSVVRFVWIVVGFAAGTVVGWAVARKFSPEWVSAVGTCVGAVGTIAAILWAVHTFQHQLQLRQDDLVRETNDKRQREFELAQNVTVRASGGAADGLQESPGEPQTWSLKDVWIQLINGTNEPVVIEHLELPGIAFRGSVMRVLPSTLPSGETVRQSIEVEPLRVSADEVSDKGPLKGAIPVLRYRITGVRWERRGEDPPMRID